MGFTNFGVVQGLLIILTISLLVIFLGSLLRIKNKKTKAILLISSVLGLIFFLVLTTWTTMNHQDRNETISKNYVGEYLLTNYKENSSYKLILKKDNTYRITQKNNLEKIEETGTWSYFDDGDIFFIELKTPKGVVQLGTNNYKFKK